MIGQTGDVFFSDTRAYESNVFQAIVNEIIVGPIAQRESSKLKPWEVINSFLLRLADGKNIYLVCRDPMDFERWCNGIEQIVNYRRALMSTL